MFEVNYFSSFNVSKNILRPQFLYFQCLFYTENHDQMKVKRRYINYNDVIKLISPKMPQCRIKKHVYYIIRYAHTMRYST